MTPYVNRTGVVALLVGDALVLPSGRVVPFDSVTGWEEDDESTPSPACLAVAQERAALLASVPPERFRLRTDLPAGQEPETWRPSPAGAEFRERIAQARVNVTVRCAGMPGAASNYVRFLAGLEESSWFRDPTDKMEASLAEIEDSFDDRLIAELALQARQVLAFLAADGRPHDWPAGPAMSVYNGARYGFIGAGSRKRWGQAYKAWTAERAEALRKGGA